MAEIRRRPGPAGASPRPAPARPASRGPGLVSLVLGPAALTLAVTLLRLVGELREWSPAWWSRLPGGGLSPLGITWLPPLVGLYLGWRLSRAGVAAPSPGRGLGLPAGALAAGFLLASLAERAFQPSWTASYVLWAGAGLAVAAASFAAWPALGRALVVYALAARVPVVLVMAVAAWRAWGTHYDAVPPGFPAMPPLKRWLWLALPQLTAWVGWTLATGALAGAAGARLARRRG